MKEEILKDENSSIIADDIGKLITANTQTIETIESLEKKISNLEETNQKLVAANGSLLKQIPAVAESELKETTVEEKKKAFDFHTVFDKNGNFKNDF